MSTESTGPLYHRGLISSLMNYMDAIQINHMRLCGSHRAIDAAVRFGFKGDGQAVFDQLALWVEIQLSRGTIQGDVDLYNRKGWKEQATPHYPIAPDAVARREAALAAGFAGDTEEEQNSFMASAMAEQFFESRANAERLHEEGKCFCCTNH